MGPRSPPRSPFAPQVPAALQVPAAPQVPARPPGPRRPRYSMFVPKVWAASSGKGLPWALGEGSRRDTEPALRETVQVLAVGSWAARALPSRSLGSDDGHRCHPTMIPSHLDSRKGRNAQGA